MALAGGLLAFGLVLAIAAFIVTREAGRLAKEPPPPLFRMDEALEWIVAKLPDIVAATLTEADVRRILGFQIEFFQRKGVAANGSSSKPPGDVVVGGSETVEYILERAKSTCPSRCTRSWRPNSRICVRSERSDRGARRIHPERDRSPPPDLLQTSDRRKEVVQTMHDKSGTSEVRGH